MRVSIGNGTLSGQRGKVGTAAAANGSDSFRFHLDVGCHDFEGVIGCGLRKRSVKRIIIVLGIVFLCVFHLRSSASSLDYGLSSLSQGVDVFQLSPSAQQVRAMPSKLRCDEYRNFIGKAKKDKDAVGIYVMPKDHNHSEMGHFMLPGIEVSPRLERVPEPLSKEGEVLAKAWLIEMGGMGYDDWCNDGQKLLPTKLLQVQKEYKDRHPEATEMPGFNLHIFDWSDFPLLPYCEEIAGKVVPKENIYYHKRSWIRFRNVTMNPHDHNDVIIHQGMVETFGRDWLLISGHPVRHFAYAVRPDILQAVNEIAASRGVDLPVDECGLANIAELPRDFDVTHMFDWEIGDPGGFLRSSVGRELDRLVHVENRPWNIQNNLVSTPGHEGRANAQTGYIEQMLRTKIMICAQRDNWEDHYRLMEAMVSGAMVMSDVMVKLPEGLVDGENIVFFSTLAEMREKLEFYLKNDETRLAIARQGRKVALEYHLPRNRMEDVFLKASPPAPIVFADVKT